MYHVRTHTGPQVGLRLTLGASSRTADAAPTSALTRLVAAPTDVMDLCINALNGAERAHLARSFQAGTRRAAAPDQTNTQTFLERLAVSNRRAFIDTMELGPLRPIIEAAVSHGGAVDAWDDLWIILNSRSHTQLTESQEVRHTLQQFAQGFNVHVAKARDLAQAVYALDCLSDAAPHTQTWLVLEGGDAEGSSSHSNRRWAGQRALLAAAQFSGAMQESLLGHVVTGSALAFAGYKEAATTVFNRLLSRDLADELLSGQGDRGLHLQHLMQSHTHFVDRCLMWIKSAALVCDSPVIYRVYLQTIAYVPEIDDRYAEPSTLNERWPVLAGEKLLGSPADIEWLRAMEFTELLESFWS